jgi:hypothetical protein
LQSHSTIIRFAKRLFARPYAVSKQDLAELRLTGLDDGKLLDLVFRVAIIFVDVLGSLAWMVWSMLVTRMFN